MKEDQVGILFGQGSSKMQCFHYLDILFCRVVSRRLGVARCRTFTIQVFLYEVGSSNITIYIFFWGEVYKGLGITRCNAFII